MAAAPAKATARAAKRKGTISEDDVTLLLHRYTPTTILTTLQEVAQCAAGRIDWRAVARKSATGITCAREYQMLWRHLAYREELVERLDAGAVPMDDDSDLEYELEPVPAPSEEALSEATVCAKVLISGSSREQARISSESPSALNIQNDKIVRVPSDKQLAQNNRLTTATGPVSNSKQALHVGGISADPFEANRPANKKKKHKSWTKEEDMELTAAVQKYGEGNWMDIIRGDYKHDRTPMQLSQRWIAICKRQGSTKPANPKPASAASSEERKAAQKAFSMALDMPMTGLSTLKSGISRIGALQQTIQHPSPAFGTIIPDAKPATAPSAAPVPISVPVPVPVPVSLPPPQLQQAPAQAAPPKLSNTSHKPRSNSKKQAAQPNPANGPSSIQAAAIAAGGRIATASTAANLLKAAQSKNAVHIRSRGTGSSKSATNSRPSNMSGEPGTQLASAQHPEPPIASAPTSSPPVLIKHIAQQVHGVSEVAGVNPPGHTAVAPLLEPKKILSSTSVCGSLENVEKGSDANITVITVEDLLPEDFKHTEIADPKTAEIMDPKDAAMLEFDRFVAQGCLNLDYLDKGKTIKDVPNAQAVGGKQNQPKPLPSVGNGNPVFSGVPATAMNIKTPVLDGKTSVPTKTTTSIGGTGNASAQNKTIEVKPAAPAVVGNQNTVQKQQTEHPKGNAMPKNKEAGTEAPTSNQANTVVSVRLVMGTLEKTSQ